MKAGILTIHNCDNFGAVLQASATLRFLSDEGIDAELINYTTPDLLLSNKMFRLPTSKRAIIDDIRNGIMFSTVSTRKREFKRFKEKYYKLTDDSFDSLEDLKELTNDYDIFITGSDQTFNLHLQGDPIYRLPYFLGFTDKKKISFASSMGDSINKISIPERDIVKEHLMDYTAISVRDEASKEYLSEILHINIDMISDPTICVDKLFWNNMLSPTPSEKYILFYSVVSEPWVVNLVNDISKELKMPVIAPHMPNRYESKSHFVRKAGIGPTDFLNLINNAELVLTTSFHACVFSLLFHKPLYAFCIGEGNRIRSLLNQVGKEELFITEDKKGEAYNIPLIDYSAIDTFFDSEREKAKQYIASSLAKLD